MSDEITKPQSTMVKAWDEFTHNMRFNFKDEQQAKAYWNTFLTMANDEKLWVNEPSPQYKRSFLDCARIVMLSGLPPDKQYGYWDIHKEKKSGSEIVVCRPMYKAFINLVLKGNQNLAFLEADVIREGDEFEDMGIAQPPKHKINLDGKGEIIGSYAVAGFKSGQYVREICTKADLDTIFKKVKLTETHYINEFKGEWAKIRAIRRLAKSLAQAMTPEQIDRFVAVEQHDNQNYDLEAR